MPLLACLLPIGGAHAAPADARPLQASGQTAGQMASLHVAFSPDRLGHATTMTLDIRIVAPPGRVPPPLTELDIDYPASIGLAVSGLGLVSCPLSTLETFGPDACPADSRMGQGDAIAEIPIGPEVLHESATVAVLRAPEREEHLALLLYASGETPVDAQLAFPATLDPTASPSIESIHIALPLVPSLPGAPDVAVTALHAIIGPRGLTYYEHSGGRLIPYHPQSILLPRRCPKGGFRFTAILTFLGGARTQTHTTIRCPRANVAPVRGG